MKNGIYHVTFSSSVGGKGEGLVVVKDGSINGGDAGYLYVGKINNSRETLSGVLNIKQWNQGHVSVFGTINAFELQISGNTSQGDFFMMSGKVPSQPGLTIQINGRFISEVA